MVAAISYIRGDGDEVPGFRGGSIRNLQRSGGGGGLWAGILQKRVRVLRQVRGKFHTDKHKNFGGGGGG